MPYQFDDHDKDQHDADRNRRYEDERAARHEAEKPFHSNWFIVGIIIAVAFVVLWYMTMGVEIVVPVPQVSGCVASSHSNCDTAVPTVVPPAETPAQPN